MSFRFVSVATELSAYAEGETVRVNVVVENVGEFSEYAVWIFDFDTMDTLESYGGFAEAGETQSLTLTAGVMPGGPWRLRVEVAP